jgi:hypothetical protein
LGVRWDYDGEVSKTDGVYKFQFQMQPNAEKIPFSIKQWRVKKGGTKNDVKKRLKEAAKSIWSWWVADHLMTRM